MSRQEYHLHFQLQANKPSLKVADSERVVLHNCFIKCLRRKIDISEMSEDSSITAWAYSQLGAKGTPMLVNSLSALRNVGLHSRLRGSTWLQVLFQVLLLYELSFKILPFLGKKRLNAQMSPVCHPMSCSLQAPLPGAELDLTAGCLNLPMVMCVKRETNCTYNSVLLFRFSAEYQESC